MDSYWTYSIEGKKTDIDNLLLYRSIHRKYPKINKSIETEKRAMIASRQGKKTMGSDF